MYSTVAQRFPYKACSPPAHPLPPSSSPSTVPSTVTFPPSSPRSSHPTSTNSLLNHRPFNFGVEFEIIIHPRDISSISKLTLPESGSTVRQTRDFNLKLLPVIAKLLTEAELHCNVFDQSSDETPDYSKWHATMDGSVSKAHIVDGFYPVEVVSPVLVADSNWPATIDKFWRVMHQHFKFHRDMSCGYHIHASTCSSGYNIHQLRRVAKSVVLWEEATDRCAPPSRQDQVMTFCKSNVDHEVEVSQLLRQDDHARGFSEAFAAIDSRSRNELVQYVCPDKYRAWNFRPSKVGGHGSIEFRRPPGVVTAKKAKHWIAFTMAFIEMAMSQDLEDFIQARLPSLDVRPSQLSEFEDLLLASARTAGVYSQLDPRLRQTDEPLTLYTSMVNLKDLAWLRRFDESYGVPTPGI